VRPAEPKVVDAPDAGAEALGDPSHRFPPGQPRQRLSRALIVQQPTRVRTIGPQGSVNLLLSASPHQGPQPSHPQHGTRAPDPYAVGRLPAFSSGWDHHDCRPKQGACPFDDVAIDHRELNGRGPGSTGRSRQERSLSFDQTGKPAEVPGLNGWKLANGHEHMFARPAVGMLYAEAGGEGFAPPFLGPKPSVLLARRPPKALARG
jgi:hypothetical protein